MANVSIIILYPRYRYVFVDQTRSLSRLMNETNFNSCCQRVRIVNLNYHASNSAFKRNNIIYTAIYNDNIIMCMLPNIII